MTTRGSHGDEFTLALSREGAAGPAWARLRTPDDRDEFTAACATVWPLTSIPREPVMPLWRGLGGNRRRPPMNEDFDCVQMKREGADSLRARLQGLTPQEVALSWDERERKLARKIAASRERHQGAATAPPIS